MDVDADDRSVDVSNWLTPNWNDPDSVDDSLSGDERLSFVERLLTNVFSGLFDTPEQTDRSAVPGDDSWTDSSDDPLERDDGDADGDETTTDESDVVDDTDADAPAESNDEDAGNESSAPVTDESETDDIEDADETDDADESDDAAETDGVDSSGDDADSDESEIDDDESAADDTTDSSASDDGDEANEDTVSDGDDGDDSETTDEDADTAADGTLDRALVEQYVHDGINEERTARGLEALEFDEDLQEIARGHSEDMAERGYFSHESPEGDSFADRYAANGYECRAYTDGGAYYTGGENIAYTYVDQPVRTDSGDVVEHTTERELADGLVDQWLNSDGHRANLLADHWNNEGIGIAVTDDNRVYATQNFC